MNDQDLVVPLVPLSNRLGVHQSEALVLDIDHPELEPQLEAHPNDRVAVPGGLATSREHIASALTLPQLRHGNADGVPVDMRFIEQAFIHHGLHHIRELVRHFAQVQTLVDQA